VVTVLCARTGAGTRAASTAELGQQVEVIGWSQPVTVRRFSDFLFLFIFPEIGKNFKKCVENTIIIRKI
jgi:hypothetical protein